MARIEVVMPQMGESIVEGTIVKWHKKVGDKIKMVADGAPARLACAFTETG